MPAKDILTRARGVCISVLVEAVDLRSLEICEGGPHPLSIGNLKEGDLVDVRRYFGLLEPGDELAPSLEEWDRYEMEAGYVDFTVERILGKVAALPAVVPGTKGLRSSLLVEPSHVYTTRNNTHPSYPELAPTWALSPGERSIAVRKGFLYAIYQDIFEWDGIVQ